ncbi:hypothetical protein PoB_005630700 [Plakobranchus ocellatus]|uniref:Uncharacterized protein n=1 Tax=Plakobranchus ocellatus TaxID=259542 RepID=A0AAV4CE45_9GAST|nr:hypothetical protein PoB_005630700 [Plakobranchus ocellatus]
MKLENMPGHQTGEDCRCTRLHCFQVTSAEERDSLVGYFNSVFNKDARDSLSAAQINVGSVERKHPTPGVVEEAENPHDHSYKNHLKVMRGGNTVSIQICMIRYMCHLVHINKRFKKVMLTFPMRGHSYLDCNKYTGFVNQQFRAEVPSDWVQHFEQAQRSPHPFTVIYCDSAVFRNLSHHLDLLFLAKCQWPADHFERSNP